MFMSRETTGNPSAVREKISTHDRSTYRSRVFI
jgi:hypothetical protein